MFEIKNIQVSKIHIKLKEENEELGLIIFSSPLLSSPLLDFDTFPALGRILLRQLKAHLIEKRQDADLHTWLIEWKNSRWLLKAECYSQSLWLEALK